MINATVYLYGGRYTVYYSCAVWTIKGGGGEMSAWGMFHHCLMHIRIYPHGLSHRFDEMHGGLWVYFNMQFMF